MQPLCSRLSSLGPPHGQLHTEPNKIKRQLCASHQGTYDRHSISRLATRVPVYPYICAECRPENPTRPPGTCASARSRRHISLSTTHHPSSAQSSPCRRLPKKAGMVARSRIRRWHQPAPRHDHRLLPSRRSPAPPQSGRLSDLEPPRLSPATRPLFPLHPHRRDRLPHRPSPPRSRRSPLRHAPPPTFNNPPALAMGVARARRLVRRRIHHRTPPRRATYSHAQAPAALHPSRTRTRVATAPWRSPPTPHEVPPTPRIFLGLARPSSRAATYSAVFFTRCPSRYCGTGSPLRTHAV